MNATDFFCCACDFEGYILREKYTHELWLVTRLSLQNRFDHWIKLVRPVDIEGSGAAGRVDAAVWGAAQVALGVQIEDSGDPGMLDGLLRHRMRLPLKLKGFGLRSCEDMKEIAYVGGLAAAVPFFCRTQRPGEAPTGLAVHLRGVVGAEPLESTEPWLPLMQSETKTGNATVPRSIASSKRYTGCRGC